MPVLETNTGTLPGNLSGITYKYYECYESNDRDTMESLLTEDFVFSSPNDDRIDRTTYFDKCWTSGVKMQAVFHFKKIFEDEDDVFLLYVCYPESRKPFQNVEILRFEGDKIKEVQVYFGNYIKNE